LVTVDLPVPGTRYRDYRSGMFGGTTLKGKLRRVWQGATHPRWAWDVGVMGRPLGVGNLAPLLGGKSGIEDYFGWLSRNFDPGISWRDIEFIRSEWTGPLVIKGILDPEDAREAAKCGADGIVVSNHGGRQLDGVLSSARALPPIADAVGGDLTILADGGIRSGLDVVRMLALGAKGVLLGRAWVYALGGGGQAGVAHVLRLIEAEMRVAMALTGVAAIDQIDRSILVES
jgi:L-lactate dehydrogenase (cytochrome)